MKARVIKAHGYYAVQFLNDLDMVIGEYRVTEVEISSDVMKEQAVR